MATFVERAGALVATAGEIARLKDSPLQADILEKCKASLILTGYDSWNGGTESYTLLLEIPIPLYAQVEDHKGQIESEIRQRVSQLIRSEYGNAISEVVISPKLLDAQKSFQSDSKTNVDGSSNDDLEPIPSFWVSERFRIFISHESKHREFVHELKESLEQFQIAAFVAHDDIEPTKEWQAEIETALRTMDGLLAFLSPTFHESKWCDQEVGFAFGRRRLIVPLHSTTDPHGFMSKYQGLNVKGRSMSAVANSVFDIIVKHDLTSQRMTDALVDKMKNASSFNTAKSVMTLLERTPSLSSSQAAHLIDSIANNYEVREAFGVPDKIRTLIKKVGKDVLP